MTFSNIPNLTTSASPLPMSLSHLEDAADENAEKTESMQSEGSRTPDLFAQYAHDRAALALKRINMMEARVYNGQEILAAVNRAWPGSSETNDQLVQKFHEVKKQERKQNRVQIQAEIDSLLSPKPYCDSHYCDEVDLDFYKPTNTPASSSGGWMNVPGLGLVSPSMESVVTWPKFNEATDSPRSDLQEKQDQTTAALQGILSEEGIQKAVKDMRAELSSIKPPLLDLFENIFSADVPNESTNPVRDKVISGTSSTLTGAGIGATLGPGGLLAAAIAEPIAKEAKQLETSMRNNPPPCQELFPKSYALARGVSCEDHLADTLGGLITAQIPSHITHAVHDGISYTMTAVSDALNITDESVKQFSLKAVKAIAENNSTAQEEKAWGMAMKHYLQGQEKDNDDTNP